MQKLIAQIEREGYCSIPQVYKRAEMDKALELVLKWKKETEDTLAEDIPFLNRNQSIVYNLQNKNHYFLKLLLESQEIQGLLMHFLNDEWYKPIPPSDPNYILRSYLARSSNEALPLHIDSFVPYIGPHVFIMQMSIILEDQNETNGCTVVVPGSHQNGEYVSQSALKDAIPIESQAGDVVIWDSRLWHGAKENASEKTRWAIIATFCRWWIKHHFNIPQNLPQEIYEKLTDSQKAILGFCSIPYNDETEGIDMKRGYQSLLADAARYRR